MRVSKRQPHPFVRMQTIFFTDRALYRPGQTIQYKGICLRVGPEQNNYEVLRRPAGHGGFRGSRTARRSRKAEHQCNDYGSFSGSFTAPRDRLMGRMTNSRADGPARATQFNVEEYKRPKFQVTLDAPKTAAKLNDKVSLRQGRELTRARPWMARR